MTLTEILEKRRERKALFEKAVAIRDKAKEEKRKMTSSEEEEFNRMMDDVDAMLKEIEREERILAVQDGTEKRTHGLVTEDQENQRQELNQEEYRQAFLTWLRNGVNGLTPEQRALMQKGFQDLPAEARALAAGTPAAGGYTVPEDFYKKLTDAELWYGGMRESRATIIQSSTGADLPMPTDDDSSNKGAIIAENTQLGVQDITFGQKVLKAYMYTSKIVRVSFQLLQDSAFDLESWLARKLGIRIARITNEHFTVGTGTSQPEGVVTGASEGKVGDTGQTTSVTFADLVDLMHAVDRAYRTNAQWMFHDSSLKALKKMEDSQNRPLWLPGIAVREPDTILGKPYIVNNDIPEMGVDAKSILFGDFSAYCIRDVLGVQLLRLVERYADFLQVGFLAFSRHDGGLLDAGTHPIKYYQNSST
jgi:HK97 family phage major capsid protein